MSLPKWIFAAYIVVGVFAFQEYRSTNANLILEKKETMCVTISRVMREKQGTWAAIVAVLGIFRSLGFIITAWRLSGRQIQAWWTATGLLVATVICTVLASISLGGVVAWTSSEHPRDHAGAVLCFAVFVILSRWLYSAAFSLFRTPQEARIADMIYQVQWLCLVCNGLTMWILHENFQKHTPETECFGGKAEWFSALLDGFYLVLVASADV